ncbi:Vsp/OspC family lipoprotein (plasmid) [Borrelia puertoricensis]|uniref:Vsp/OspC family lipoprotein n=1 Tax=Borrelia puertoricensis TaxID=2756107 RepID=UPI003EBAF9FE
MKRITLCALLMTLFLLSSCNTSGAATKDGQAAKSDGTLIDLVTITNNIKDSVAFAKDVKEIHTLVKSIDELAKAIGKKIQDQDTLAVDTNQNGSLLAGVFNLMFDIKNKLTQLEAKADKFVGIKEKVTAAKNGSAKFIATVRSKHSELGKNNANDTDAEDAIHVVKKPNGDKGAKDLADLNKMIDDLFNATNTMVLNAIKELTTSTKPSN